MTQRDGKTKQAWKNILNWFILGQTNQKREKIRINKIKAENGPLQKTAIIFGV